MSKTKIAIACQGGGSQAAFTAGVLKAFFDNEIDKKYDIVSFSGTSGGAVCAALAWYSLLLANKNGETPDMTRLEAFWEDNSTQNIFEIFHNFSVVNTLQLIHSGILPQWHAGPGSLLFMPFLFWSKLLHPRQRYLDFQGLLEDHIKFNQLPDLVQPNSPRLLIGAANVCKGTFKKFNSHPTGENSNDCEIQAKTILASAAVPTLFNPVKIDGELYWDGLLSENPPIDELFDPNTIGEDKIPDEIWVIKINPVKRGTVPTTISDIFDRRNEMVGNLSLRHEEQKVNLFNSLLEEGAFTKAFLTNYGISKPIKLNSVTMPESLAEELDYVSKVDRSHNQMKKLFIAGLEQGEKLMN